MDTRDLVSLIELTKVTGIIFHLWHDDQVVPDGRVTIPNSVGHVFRTE